MANAHLIGCVRPSELAESASTPQQPSPCRTSRGRCSRRRGTPRCCWSARRPEPAPTSQADPLAIHPATGFAPGSASMPIVFMTSGSLPSYLWAFVFPVSMPRGGDLPPRRECAPAWRPSLMKELKSVELIVCLGLHAQRWHMGDAARKSLSETVANWREGLKLSPPVFPLPHPSWRNNAWLKANPWFETDLLPVLRRQREGAREMSVTCGPMDAGLCDSSRRRDRGNA
jgi:hypothetical protein